MCGRYTASFSVDELEVLFDGLATDVEIVPRYNVAPTQIVPVVVDDQGTKRLTPMRWGLEASWSRGAPLINARAETIESKPTFRRLLEQRCLVPADSFYEWKARGSSKVPYRVTLPKHRVFAFAGLWSVGSAGERCFTILTVPPSVSLENLHNRMPVILTEQGMFATWLRDPFAKASAILQSYGGPVTIIEVSTWVNSPRNDDERCIQAANKLW